MKKTSIDTFLEVRAHYYITPSTFFDQIQHPNCKNSHLGDDPFFHVFWWFSGPRLFYGPSKNAKKSKIGYHDFFGPQKKWKKVKILGGHFLTFFYVFFEFSSKSSKIVKIVKIVDFGPKPSFDPSINFDDLTRKVWNPSINFDDLVRNVGKPSIKFGHGHAKFETHRSILTTWYVKFETDRSIFMTGCDFLDVRMELYVMDVCFCIAHKNLCTTTFWMTNKSVWPTMIFVEGHQQMVSLDLILRIFWWTSSHQHVDFVHVFHELDSRFLLWSVPIQKINSLHTKSQNFISTYPLLSSLPSPERPITFQNCISRFRFVDAISSRFKTHGDVSSHELNNSTCLHGTWYAMSLKVISREIPCWHQKILMKETLRFV